MMYAWLTQFAQGSFCVQLAERGASEAELTMIEERLGIPLPPTYREFLKLRNGGDLNGDVVSSTAELLDAVEEYGFRPFIGEIERTSGEKILYRAKPAHCLPFCTRVLSPDLYCFDTRPSPRNEYPICLYDHEVAEFETLLRLRFPSFEAFLLFKAFHLTDDLEYFLDLDMEVTDDDERRAEERCEYWEQTLRQLLTERGADFSNNEWWPTWQNWKGTLLPS